MKGADFQGAHLENAQLQNTDLRYAQLQGAHLKGTNFREARLSYGFKLPDYSKDQDLIEIHNDCPDKDAQALLRDILIGKRLIKIK